MTINHPKIGLPGASGTMTTTAIVTSSHGSKSSLLNTNFALLIFFALCCNSCFFLPLIFGIVGLVTSKNPDAKQRA